FEVADEVQILAERRTPPRILIIDQFIVGAAGAERGNDVFGREHTAANSVMDALDARHIYKPRRAADQGAAGEGQARYRLITALADGARAVGEPFAAFEQGADRRMGLEALEFIERRQIRVVVIEMHDETDRHQIIIVVIEERAAAGLI